MKFLIPIIKGYEQIQYFDTHALIFFSPLSIFHHIYFTLHREYNHQQNGLGECDIPKEDREGVRTILISPPLILLRMYSPHAPPHPPAGI